MRYALLLKWIRSRAIQVDGAAASSQVAENRPLLTLTRPGLAGSVDGRLSPDLLLKEIFR